MRAGIRQYAPSGAEWQAGAHFREGRAAPGSGGLHPAALPPAP